MKSGPSCNPALYFTCLLSFLALTVAGCTRNANAPHDVAPASTEITVSAAASLRNAFQEIGQLYEARTGQRVSFNFGAPGALQRQIEAAAPVDVFASAGVQQMDALANKNLIDQVSRRNFGRNELVIVTSQTNSLNINSFADLESATVRRIAIGNPRTVPAGQYAEQVFNHFNLTARLQPKLILAEDVRQVLDYVVRGEADAGVVYRTDTQTVSAAVRIASVAPETAHEPILYPIAIVRESRNREAAETFIEIVTGMEGQTVLRRHGFKEASER